ncbi:hypothetical protein QBC44DRAFT_61308 [Cladorrhinum sp. PSN332]|nr:hypothetical protein QBC44DRAFT_61308 [Cladorrhinum sp. PSN332]
MSPAFQILYILVLLALSGVALYLYTLSNSLSLPISPTASILTALLPLISPLATLFPEILNPIFSFLATILLTLDSSTLFNTPPCLLETTWRGHYSSHDADKIRKIQDSLNCCGYRNVKDMAWPFPHKGAPVSQCGEQFGRTEGCMGKWGGELKRVSGGELGVVLAVVAVQVFVGVLNATRGGNDGWLKWLFARGVGGGREERRGLLTGGEVEDDEEVGNGGGGGVNGRLSDGEGRQEQWRRDQGYGGIEENSPRVEVSHRARGPWDDDRD